MKSLPFGSSKVSNLLPNCFQDSYHFPPKCMGNLPLLSKAYVYAADLVQVAMEVLEAGPWCVGKTPKSYNILFKNPTPGFSSCLCRPGSCSSQTSSKPKCSLGFIE